MCPPTPSHPIPPHPKGSSTHSGEWDPLPAAWSPPARVTAHPPPALPCPPPGSAVPLPPRRSLRWTRSGVGTSPGPAGLGAGSHWCTGSRGIGNPDSPGCLPVPRLLRSRHGGGLRFASKDKSALGAASRLSSAALLSSPWRRPVRVLRLCRGQRALRCGQERCQGSRGCGWGQTPGKRRPGRMGSHETPGCALLSALGVIAPPSSSREIKLMGDL